MSIIISAYNSTGYVAEMPNDLNVQVDKPYEVVIVDYGSDDSTYDVVKFGKHDSRIEFARWSRCSVASRYVA